jgi:hypothetical protein
MSSSCISRRISGSSAEKRLVEEPDLRLDRQRPGDAHPLLLAARELARIVAVAALRAR